METECDDVGGVGGTRIRINERTKGGSDYGREHGIIVTGRN